MTVSSDINLAYCHRPRRTFLKLTTATAVAGIAGGSVLQNFAHADALTKVERDGMTPDEILDAMKRGNERFSQGKRIDRSFLKSKKPAPKDSSPQL